MQIPPHSVVATWPAPNFINPPTHGSGVILVNLILYPIVILILTLRVFTRIRVISNFGSNDILILAALIPTTVFMIVSILADLVYDWKRHQWDIPADQAVRGLKMIIIAETMFATGITLTKLSILTLIKLIYTSSSRIYQRLINLSILLVGLQGIIFCLVVIFQCRPPQEFWALSVHPQPACINQGTVLLVGGVINTLTDFVVVLLPIKTVLGLNLPTRQKWIVSGLFGLGLLSAAAGVARTYYTYMVTRTYDQTWAAFPVWLTSAIELYIGMICCSIPLTKPFFTKYCPKLLSIARTSEEDGTQLYDYSSRGEGGTRGTAKLEENRVLLRHASWEGEDFVKPGSREFNKGERSYSVFEE